MSDLPIMRLAVERDLPELRSLMARAIGQLQKAFLSTAEIEASRQVMGLDTQLIADRTYYVAEQDGTLIGCGGWSRRATLFGGDHSVSLREPRLLDPAHDPARVRAMYTDPAFARRGIGRLILATCEEAAAAQGFSAAELMATLAGEPLYRACGYTAIERIAADVDGIAVPLVRMGKALPATAPSGAAGGT
jgi:GNAT superfamily N-acetyltransferase